MLRTEGQKERLAPPWRAAWVMETAHLTAWEKGSLDESRPLPLGKRDTEVTVVVVTRREKQTMKAGKEACHPLRGMTCNTVTLRRRRK